MYGGEGATPPSEPGLLGEAYCVGGGDSCWDGGLRGSEGRGSSSSESSGVYWGRGGKLLSVVDVLDGSAAGGARDLLDMIPAMAAAGPRGEAGSAGLDGSSGSAFRVASGDGAAEGDVSFAAPVSSI